MKIGLITFHDTNNFGSYLQTYGLYKKVEDLGYNCEVIDYQCKSIVQRELPKKSTLTLNPRTILKDILFERVLRNKYKKLNSFLHNKMKVGNRYNRSTINCANDEYDKFLVGSDIVWGMDIIEGDTTYFLDFVKDRKKKYAFASSIGNQWNSAEKKLLAPLLSDFQCIAVREEESAKWVEELTARRPNVVCDPTMLLDSEEWSSLKSDKYSKDKYVLVYFPTEACLEAAKKMAKKKGVKCVCINYGLPYKGVSSVCPTTMEDFLSLFYYAEYVVTASYHGMLFSIYFNREFAYYNRAHKSRMNTLAKRLGVQSREGSEYDILKMKPIDYSKVNEAVDEYRNYSIQVLKEMLAK